jgi:hypothetical protein
METELDRITHLLERATTPEEVFGALNSSGPARLVELKQRYHRLAKVSHPDVYPDARARAVAQAAFTRLTEWYLQAEARVKAGSYGSAGAYGNAGAGPDQVVLQTQTRTYTLGGTFTESGIYNLYSGRCAEGARSTPVTLKIVRDPQYNDLAHNEIQILRLLQGGQAAAKFSAYLPPLKDAFQLGTAGEVRQVAVYEETEGWYSLEEVRQAYPAGVDPRDMAWIWRRLLVVLGFAHLNAVIHGTVLPDAIRIQPEQHGLILGNWSAAIQNPHATGEVIPVIHARYAAWYPEEILNSESPLPGSDIYLAARCMAYLLGGSPGSGRCPAAVPAPIRSFLRGCTLPGKRSRPQDAWQLKDEFDELLHRLWGERKFHPFFMPLHS